ncbi:U3 snoRNP protein [Malassezia yamatoensis]|uniref:U3 snoRNP protein n=1 Tax=Malassezia yamatoensis TaxID=253288 RepID=A0AAJ5YUF5_9BASI|nr:U3 snoRNP protein [Malassezia yamatoensis]
MERVQYSLERSLPQLRLLDEHKILTKDELRSITSQRQALEARLIRRKADKADFLEYLSLEHDLNDLVLLRAKKRVHDANSKLKKEEDKHKKKLLPRNFFRKQAATYSAVCISIFERMVQKFRYDVSAWEQYIAWARKLKMRVVVGRVFARALSLHPTHVSLWISAADYELNGNADTTAARTILQRGIRTNPLVSSALPGHREERGMHEYPSAKLRKTSSGAAQVHQDFRAIHWILTEYEQGVLRLWVEYFRMELVFIERLRRRWRVLGLDSGAEKVSMPTSMDAFGSVRETAHTVAPEDHELGSEHESDSSDDEASALEASAQNSVPEASLNEPESFSAPVQAPEAGAKVPSGHQQIMSGSIPLVLLANAQKTLPAAVQLYLYIALLLLFSEFPFYDSVILRENGEVVSVRCSDGPLGTGDQLRNRLIHGVLTNTQSTAKQNWGEAGEQVVQVLSSLHAILHPWSSSIHSELEWSTLPASVAKDELEDNHLLHGASRLHSIHELCVDSLYPLAQIPVSLRIAESGAGVLDPWSIAQPVLFLLNLLSARLVVRSETPKSVEDQDNFMSLSIASDELSVNVTDVQWSPTTYLAMLAQSGDLPLAIRAVITGFQQQVPTSTDSFTLAYLSVLRFLANPTRAGIDEENLLKYIARAEDKLLSGLLNDGPHLDLAWLALEKVMRRVSQQTAKLSPDSKELSSLFTEAKRLVKTDRIHPGAWLLYERIGFRIAQLQTDDTLESPFNFHWVADSTEVSTARNSWVNMLDACTSVSIIAQDITAPVWGLLVLYLECTGSTSSKDGNLIVPHSARISLWVDYILWVQRIVSDEANVPRKRARKAKRWAQSSMELAVTRTAALLASSQLVGTARAHAQALHDAVVERVFFSIGVCSNPAEDNHASPDHVKDHMSDWLLRTSSASVDCWLQLAQRDSASSEVVSDNAHVENFQRAKKFYERAVSQAERESSPNCDSVWLAYLSFLVKTKRDIPTAVSTMQRALQHLSALDAAQAQALQRSWQALIGSDV